MIKTTKMRHVLMLIMTCVVGTNVGMVEGSREAALSGAADSLQSRSSDPEQRTIDEVTELRRLIAEFGDPTSANNSKLANDCGALSDRLGGKCLTSDIQRVLMSIACLKTSAIDEKLTDDQKTNIAKLAQAASGVINAYEKTTDDAMKSMRDELIHNALYAMANQSNKFTCIAEIYSMLIESIPETFHYITQNFKGILFEYDCELSNPQDICDQINSKSSNHAISRLECMLENVLIDCSKGRLIEARHQFSNILIMMKIKRYIHSFFNTGRLGNANDCLVNMFLTIIGWEVRMRAIDTNVFLKNLEPHISNIMSEGAQRLSLENLHGRFNKAMDALNTSAELL